MQIHIDAEGVTESDGIGDKTRICMVERLKHPVALTMKSP